MKKTDYLIKDYVSKLNLDTLSYLAERLRDRVGSDIAEATEVLSKHVEMDKLLASSKNAEEFFNMLDYIGTFVEKEYNKRSPELVR